MMPDLMRDLTRGPIPGHILAMATPIAVGMFVQTMYHLVDLFFVAQLGGPAVAGVGTAGNLHFIVLALTQSLSVGTIALVSHAVGRKDRAHATLIFNQALFLGGLLGAGMLVVGYLGLGAAFVRAVGADAETVAAGLTYLRWLAPAFALQFVGAAMGAALQGTGIVKPTMVIQMISVMTNVVMTPVLVAGWLTGRPLGVAGAGLSSSIAAVAGITMLTVYFLRAEHYIELHPALWRPRLQELRRMLAIGLPAGGEFVLLFVNTATIYAVIGAFGVSAQAGFGVGMRVMQAVFLPALAIGFSLPAIAGQNFGARDAGRVRATFRYGAMINIGLMGAVTLVCQVRPEWFVGPFSSDAEVLLVAALFFRLIAWNFIAAGLNFCCSGMFQAMGNTLPALASSAGRLVTFVLPMFVLSRYPWFRIEHICYLSVASAWLQMSLSLFLLRGQLRRRLEGMTEGEVHAV